MRAGTPRIGRLVSENLEEVRLRLGNMQAKMRLGSENPENEALAHRDVRLAVCPTGRRMDDWLSAVPSMQ